MAELLQKIQSGRSRTLKLTIIRQRDKLEIVFKVCKVCLFLYTRGITIFFQHFLCEDRSSASDSNFSYVDFLCHMHKEIRAILN